MTDRNTDAPADAVEDRAAQDHELADIESGGKAIPGLYPSDSIPDRKGDITPDAPHPTVEWDERVQRERPDEQTSDEKEPGHG